MSAAGGYGQGVAVGDYDGDGFPDIYVTQYGKSILYHNNGDGTFTDVTEKAGVAAPGWSSSAVWFDYDNDGRLDLFVCRFVDFNKAKNMHCNADDDGKRDTASRPSTSRWRAGSSTTMAMGHLPMSANRPVSRIISARPGASSRPTSTTTDCMDLFVANDTVAEFPLHQPGKGKFEEIGRWQAWPTATTGRPRSGMGVDSADFNEDGWMDLFVANIDHEMYSLYQNNHDETFDDQALPTGIGSGYPPDERLGAEVLRLRQRRQPRPAARQWQSRRPDRDLHHEVTYREPCCCFTMRVRSWRTSARRAGPSLRRALSARGLAIGDFNNDGALDVLISVNDDAPFLLRNNVAARITGSG